MQKGFKMHNPNATETLMGIDPNKKVVPFGSGRHSQFSHADLQDLGDPTGISIQEGEFLYGLVRLILPKRILETGTNVGISTSYMALGMQHNGYGTIDTIEHDSTVAARARKKIAEMKFDNIITVHNTKVELFNAVGEYDLLWLDSELAIRYGELLRFWNNVAPGGIICIHDLHSLDFSEFGGVPQQMKDLIKSGQLRGVTFASDHGVTMFQKRRTKDHFADIQNNLA